MITRIASHILGIILMLGFWASSASAQTWTGPDSTRRTYLLGHAVENFDFAISEVCLPYLLQRAEAAAWNRRRGVAPFPAGGPFVGLSAYLVGGSAGAIVGVGDRLGHRECTIKGDSTEIENYVGAVDSRLTPMGFTRAPDELFPPSTVGERHLYCGSAEGPQLVAITTSRDGQRGEFLLTLFELEERDVRCIVVDALTNPHHEGLARSETEAPSIIAP